jgi:hypothetical protein
MRPHIYRTRDGGATWTRIVAGLPESGPVNVVREDPAQPGLLFAGTERGVYFSADDGAAWQDLRMNMPATSVRDLVVKEHDLVVGTHGRSIWILDDVAPLREVAGAAAAGGAFLFTPPPATRVRWNMFSDTPLPPEEPTGENPPDGAILDYYLADAAGEVVLEIVDEGGDVVRRYASTDPPEAVDSTALPHPTYWIRPPRRPGVEAGHHRFVWDLRYTPPPGADREFTNAAVNKNTPSGPHGPYVPPGVFRVRLTVDGSTYERPLTVRLDPRVAITGSDLQLQTEYSMLCYTGYLRAQVLREAIEAALETASSSRREAMARLRGTGTPGDPDIVYGSIYAAPDDQETVTGLQQKFLFLLNVLQAADVRPTTQTMEGVRALNESLQALTRRWEGLR